MADEAPSVTGIGVPERQRPAVPAKTPNADYPLIDSDPHVSRVYRYTRPRDWLKGAAVASIPPVFMWANEKISPSYAGRGAFPRMMRLAGVLGLMGGLIIVGQDSTFRFLGVTENAREREMDMREMVEKVKKGQPLYGASTLSESHQGMAARNSRNSAFFLHVVPMFNFVNHNHHGVDTAKYYQQAERELEAERGGKVLS